MAAELPKAPSAAMSAGMELSTPMDIKMGLTSAADVAHPLRWGFMTAGRICADMAQACLIAAGRGCGATLGAGNPQRFSRRANTVRKLVSGPRKLEAPKAGALLGRSRGAQGRGRRGLREGPWLRSVLRRR